MDDAMLDLENFYAKGGEVDAIIGISKNLKNSTSTETSFYPIRAKVPTKFIQEVGFKLENKDDYVKVTEIQFDTKKIMLQGYDEDGENYDGEVGYKLDGLSKDFQKWIKRNLIRKARREQGNSYFAKGGKITSSPEYQKLRNKEFDKRVKAGKIKDTDENFEKFDETYFNELVKKGVIDMDDYYAKGGKTQGYNARLDESLAMRRGKAKSKKQTYKGRRDESKGENKAKGKRAYSSVKTMDKKVKYRGRKK
jgi:hypothetical protein